MYLLNFLTYGLKAHDFFKGDGLERSKMTGMKESFSATFYMDHQTYMSKQDRVKCRTGGELMEAARDLRTPDTYAVDVTHIVSYIVVIIYTIQGEHLFFSVEV